MIKGSVNSLRSLEKSFMKNKGMPYFTVWKGSNKKAGAIVYRNDDEDNMDAAFDLLYDEMKRRTGGGGTFTIHQGGTPKVSSGRETVLDISGRDRDSVGRPGEGFSSIGGVTGYVNLAVENATLKMKNERLEEEKTALEEDKNKFAALESFAGSPAIQSFIEPFAKLAGAWAQQKAGAAIAGASGGKKTKVSFKNEVPDNTENDDASGEEEMDLDLSEDSVAALIALEQMDIDLDAVLPRLPGLLEGVPQFLGIFKNPEILDNPEMIKGFLNAQK